jgi:hypothetical protein
MRRAYEEPTVPSSSPLKLRRQHLEDARARGEQFVPEWQGAVKVALEVAKPSQKREWRDALEHTRSTWQRCYDRQPATPAELALVNARVLIDREPLPDAWCERCGGPLGADPIGHKFCSRDCSREASAVASIAPFGTRRGPMRQPEVPLAA